MSRLDNINSHLNHFSGLLSTMHETGWFGLKFRKVEAPPLRPGYQLYCEGSTRSELDTLDLTVLELYLDQMAFDCWLEDRMTQ